MKKYFWFFILCLIPIAAFAQDPDLGGQFKLLLTPQDSDLSVKYLSYIFGNVDGILRGEGSQIIGQMFGVFNMAVLSAGGAILLYILIISTINTAHEGQMLGKKWSSIWIPLRSLIGVSLLVPKASGYSYLQIFMMWVVLQGIGAANSLWNVALGYIETGGAIVQAPGSAPKASGELQNFTADLFSSLTCMAALQESLEDRAKDLGGDPPPQLIDGLIPLKTGTNAKRTATTTLIYVPGKLPNLVSYKGVCGTVKLPDFSLPAGKDANDTAEATRALAVQQMILDLYYQARAVVRNEKLDKNVQRDTKDILSEFAIYDTTQTYMSIMRFALASSITPDESLAELKKDGWISAGQFYSTLVSAGSKEEGTSGGKDLGSLINNGLPSIPKFDPGKNLDSAGLVGSYKDLVMNGYNKAKKFGNNNKANFPKSGIDSGGKSPCKDPTSGTEGEMGLDGIAQFSCVLEHAASEMEGNVNPMKRLASLGQTLINASLLLWIALLVLAITIGVLAGLGIFFHFATAFASIMTWLAPFATMLTMALLVPGATLAYYIPLIPFIIFTFAAIGWLTAVIEMMAAAPIVALGAIHPEGHEVFGRAEQSIMLILNVFLRPMLMIFGFIAGIILSYVSLWILNQGFLEAFEQGLSMGGASGLASGIAGIAKMVVYTLIAMSFVNLSFGLTGEVPDRILRWLGGGMQEAFGGDKAVLGEIKSAAGSLGAAGGQLASAAQRASTEASQTFAHEAGKDTEAAEKAKKDAGEEKRGGGGKKPPPGGKPDKEVGEGGMPPGYKPTKVQRPAPSPPTQGGEGTPGSTEGTPRRGSGEGGEGFF